MIIGYKRPSGIAWSLSDASFLTDVLLDNGRPADETQILWEQSASPISEYIDLRADWSQAQNVRVLCLLGLRHYQADNASPSSYTQQIMPAGVRIVATGKRFGDGGYAYALGGNSTTGVTVELPDGTVACWFVLDAGLTSLIGVQFRIYNDADDEMWVGPQDYFGVGEVGIFAGAEIGAAPGWQISWSDPTITNRTIGGQLHRVARQAWRECDLTIVPAEEESVRASGLQNSQDYEKIANALRYSVPCAFIPHWRDTSSVFDSNILHRTALFGAATPGPLTHIARRISGHAYKVGEIPAAGLLPT